MCKRQFGFLVVAFLLTCTQVWAAGNVASSPAVAKESKSIAHTYSATLTGDFEAAVPTEGCTAPCDTETYTPGDNVSRLFQFTGFTDTLEIKFRKVKNTFPLTIMRHPLSAADFAARLGEGVFTPNSTCYQYFSSTNETPCVGYDAFGTLPIKGTDYLGPVTWTLKYLADDSNSSPALGHAKGTSFTYTEDLLQFYFTPVNTDPTMQGSSDGLSSVATIKQPLTENDSFCWVSPNDLQSFTVGAEVEVAFRLFASGCSGTPIRDKDARMSVARFDSGQLVVVPVRGDEGGNRHFHFEHDDGVNEREFETEGLPIGTYFITVFSNKFSPQTVRIVLTQ